MSDEATAVDLLAELYNAWFSGFDEDSDDHLLSRVSDFLSANEASYTTNRDFGDEDDGYGPGV